jgi:phosphoglycolate phosphatase
MFENRSLILFDLDGTLIDSVPDLALAVNAMLDRLGRAPYSEETIRGWIGNGSAMLVRRALAGSRELPENFDEALFARAHPIFLEAYAGVLARATRAYPEVPETLAVLRERGYRMAIVTNKPGQFVAPILERLGLAEYFELTVGGEDLPVKKPDPAPLLHACERMATPKNRALMVGDSANDILAARKAGIPVVAVSYGYTHDTPVEAYGPDQVVARFGELREILRGRG